eukprot:TRINITY_DN9766_c0_g1_i1.p1 TRINITY_DN9766_c0_g1~~TRINITY_DN9766_c0_g1_i1.p1  ORF type:complete len:155 (+),score=29.67 TRINITY_DN9766_c0_g1_i1:357-821(+)
MSGVLHRLKAQYKTNIRPVQELMTASAEAKDLVALLFKVAADGVELLEQGALQQGHPALSAWFDLIQELNSLRQSSQAEHLKQQAVALWKSDAGQAVASRLTIVRDRTKSTRSYSTKVLKFLGELKYALTETSEFLRKSSEPPKSKSPPPKSRL